VSGQSTDRCVHGLAGHHCKPVASYFVVPTTLTPVANDIESYATAMWNSIGLPMTDGEYLTRYSFPVVASTPPDDLIIKLRRLVI